MGFIVAIGDALARQNIFEKLENIPCNIVSLIHPKAVVSRRVEIKKGTVVMAGAVINSDTKIGKGCIVNTGASVDHDGTVDDFVHISVRRACCWQCTYWFENLDWSRGQLF